MFAVPDLLQGQVGFDCQLGVNWRGETYAELYLFVTFVRFEVLTALTVEITVLRAPAILKMEAADTSVM